MVADLPVGDSEDEEEHEKDKRMKREQYLSIDLGGEEEVVDPVQLKQQFDAWKNGPKEELVNHIDWVDRDEPGDCTVLVSAHLYLLEKLFIQVSLQSFWTDFLARWIWILACESLLFERQSAISSGVTSGKLFKTHVHVLFGAK